jgi:hypothetical protein
MIFGIGSGLSFGVIFGLGLGDHVLSNLEKPRFTDRLVLAWGVLFLGLFVGLGFGLIRTLSFGLPIELGTVLGVGLVAGVVGGLKPRQIKLKSRPNESIWRSLQNGLVVGLGLGLVFWLTIGLAAEMVFELLTGLVAGLGFGLVFGSLYGLSAVIAHAILRRVLWRTGDAPLNYAEFLRYTTSRHLTRQIGGGFIFRHRLLMDHFAESDW